MSLRVQVGFSSEDCDFTQCPFRSASLTEGEVEKGCESEVVDCVCARAVWYVNVNAHVSVGLSSVFALGTAVGREALCVCVFVCMYVCVYSVLNFEALKIIILLLNY